MPDEENVAVAQGNQGSGEQGLTLSQLKKEMFEEILAMSIFALELGKTIPADVATELDSLPKSYSADAPITFASLTVLHNALSAIIAPVVPRSIFYIRAKQLNREEGPSRFIRFLGPIPTIRYMVVLSVIALFFFIYFSISGKVNAENLKTSLLYRQGADQLEVALFLLSAAAIGALFASLYSANQYVVQGTYNPDYNATYWIRIALGLTSGYVLSELVFLDDTGTLSQGAAFSKPLLALLGGFSASAVYRILNRLVEAVESIVQGDTKARVAAREVELQAQMKSNELMQRTETVGALIKTRNALEAGGAPKDVLDAEFNKLITQTLAGTSAS